MTKDVESPAVLKKTHQIQYMEEIYLLFLRLLQNLTRMKKIARGKIGFGRIEIFNLSIGMSPSLLSFPDR